MVQDLHVKHHQHIRKRKYKKNFQSDKMKRIIDKLVYIAGFFGLAMTIPQILIIWIGQNASGISIITWASYFIIGAVFIAYGIVHKEKPLIIIYILWEILYVIIIVGALIYG
ncbi:hypothetical protein HOD75_00200 [archaeon]|jgi:uncharacterized protein with PQ loop repeat|nr:hypothetical protein [archaeon]MBT4241298.1 hypothetical protein [archaeon]MBT4418120.1 hypothetical protein [archaeon]